MKRDSLFVCAALLIVSMMLVCVFPVNALADDEPAAVVKDGYPQPAIWSLQNTVSKPAKELILEVKAGDSAQAVAAASIVPAFINRRHVQALMFDDGYEARTLPISADKKKVSDFGSEASAMTNKIATTYWAKAEIIVVTDTYEHTLWAVPIASFINAPIIVSPAESTISSLSAKYAIVIGGGTSGIANAANEFRFTTAQDVWAFQLRLYATKGYVCDYIVAANPNDLSSKEWQGASLPASIVAAYRNAIVSTTNHPVEKDKQSKLAKGKAKEDEIYAELKPIWNALKADIATAASTLKTHTGQNPKYMTMVGGAWDLPYYFIDMSGNRPTIQGKTYGDFYVCSVAPYANLSTPSNWNGTTYLKEDFAIGRLAGHSIIDITYTLFRTIFYREFLTGGKYAALAPAGWENRAIYIDGHNQSQPENLDYIGPKPTDGVWYYPAKETIEQLNVTGFTTKDMWPENVTKTGNYNSDAGINEIWQEAAKTNLFIAHSHGDPDSTWLEVGKKDQKWPGWKGKVGFNFATGKWYVSVFNASVSPANVTYKQDMPSELNFAPCLSVQMSCYGTEISDGTAQNNTYSGAMLHSGAVVFIGPTEYQAKCYWNFVPKGVGTLIGLTVVEKTTSENKPVGTAFIEAKWEAWSYWKNQGHQEDRDAHMFLLYGDPKFENYKPQKPFADLKEFDIKVAMPSGVSAGSEFDLTVTVTDLSSGATVSDAAVAVTFNGKTYSGSSSKIKTPDAKGQSLLTITVSKAGYTTATAKYTIDVKERGGTDSNGGLDTTAIAAVAVVVIVVILVLVVLMRRKKPKQPADSAPQTEQPPEEQGPKVMG